MVSVTVSKPAAAVNESAFERVLRLLWWVPGVSFSVVFLVRSARSPVGSSRFTLFDDAMISMAYARTFAETGELVWFEGADRVQGITNPLWTAIMSVIHLAGFEGSAAALIVSSTGIGLLVVNGWLARRITIVMTGNETLGAVGGGAVMLLYPLIFWSLRGMEVGLLAACSLLLMLSIADPRQPRVALAVPAIVVGVATRVDFAVISGAMAAAVFISARSARPGKALRVWIVAVLAATTVSAGAVLALQLWYFGDALPNTYFLKVEGYTAFDRIARGVVSLGKAFSVLAVAAWAAWRLQRFEPSQRVAVAALASVVASSAGYSVWVGGDAWESFLMFSRYITVGLPAAMILLVMATHRVRESRAIVAVGCGAVVAALGAGLVSNPYRFHVGFAVTMVAVVATLVAGWIVSVARGRALMAVCVAGCAVVVMSSIVPMARWALGEGLHLEDDQRLVAKSLAVRDLTDPAATVAVVGAGAPGYFLDRPLIDLLGKSDAVVAHVEPRGDLYPGHNKWDYDYSIGQQRPDVIMSLWQPTSQVREDIASWGYERRCFAVGDESSSAYFLTASTSIDWTALHDC